MLLVAAACCQVTGVLMCDAEAGQQKWGLEAADTVIGAREKKNHPFFFFCNAVQSYVYRPLDARANKRHATRLWPPEQQGYELWIACEGRRCGLDRQGQQPTQRLA